MAVYEVYGNSNWLNKLIKISGLHLMIFFFMTLWGLILCANLDYVLDVINI